MKYNRWLKENNGKDLIIINIQPNMENRITFDIENFGSWFDKTGDSYNSIYYLYNGKFDTDMSDQKGDISKWFEQKLHIMNGFVSTSFSLSHIKDTFSILFDTDYDNEEIITVGKFLYNHNYDKIENISDEDVDLLDISDEFKDDLKTSRISFNIPYDLIQILKETSSPVIVGGLKHESIRMISILFSIIDKQFTVIPEYVY